MEQIVWRKSKIWQDIIPLIAITSCYRQTTFLYENIPEIERNIIPVTGNFLWQENIPVVVVVVKDSWCMRKLPTIPVTGRNFLLKNNISCSMKGIVYCWVKFLSQKERVEQNSSHKKKFSVAWRQFLLMNKIPAAGNIFHSRGKLNVAGNNSYHKPQMKEFLSQEEISCCNRSIPIAGKNKIVSERNLIVWQEFLLTNKIPVAGNISSSSGKSYATGNNSCQKKTPKKSFLIVWRKFLLMNKIPAAGNISCSKEKLYATGNNSCDEKGIQNYFLRKKYLYCRKKINYWMMKIPVDE